MRQTFHKSERLCSKKVIDQLFEKGSSTVRTFYLFPFRVLYLPKSENTVGEAPAPFPAILITVSKRNFKHAVDRNLLRRRIREAYRKNKPFLFRTTEKPKNAPEYIAFLYTARQKISFEEIEKSMKLVLAKM
jgi:ribonuclease P protein component